MLEFLSALLLIFLLFVAVMVWFGIKLTRKAVRTMRSMAANFGAVMPTVPAMPDPRWARLSTLLDRSQREKARCLLPLRA